MLDIKNVKALGEYVVCKLNEEIIKDKKLESGLVLPAMAQIASASNKMNVDGQQKPAYLTIHDIGPKVPTDCGFQIGQEVCVNLYDAAKVGDSNKMFMLFNYKSIMGVVEATRD